jgi:hypothetical protein
MHPPIGAHSVRSTHQSHNVNLTRITSPISSSRPNEVPQRADRAHDGHVGLRGLYRPAVIPLHLGDPARHADVMQKLKKWASTNGGRAGVCLFELSLDGDTKFTFNYKPWDCNLQQAELDSSTLADFARSALEQSGQLAYLLQHGDKLVNDEYGVLVGILFVSERHDAQLQFHMDGARRGATLFTNVIYDTDAPLDGEEFIVNPETLKDRIDVLKDRDEVPPLLLEHLLDVRNQAERGDLIERSEVKPGEMLSYTNLTNYHKWPDRKSRGADPASAESFLRSYFRSSFPQCMDLVAREGSSAGLTPNESEFMASVDKGVLSLARHVSLAKVTGRKIYFEDLQQAGVSRLIALDFLGDAGANPTHTVSVQEGSHWYSYPLTEPPRVLRRELSEIRESANVGLHPPPQTRCFAAVTVTCGPRS